MLRTYTCQPLFFYCEARVPLYGTNQDIPCISRQPLILSPEHLHNQAWFAVGTESGIYSGREKKKGDGHIAQCIRRVRSKVLFLRSAKMPLPHRHHRPFRYEVFRGKCPPLSTGPPKKEKLFRREAAERISVRA